MWTELGKQWRFHGLAPDGQPLHMYFYPRRENRFTCWSIGLFVGGSNRTANNWFSKGKPFTSRITGNGSISVLKYALDKLLEFASRMQPDEEIRISWEDDRRYNAYRWLLKLPNWQEAGHSYRYRNPKYWGKAEKCTLIEQQQTI
jgi:hypothetical protein